MSCFEKTHSTPQSKGLWEAVVPEELTHVEGSKAERTFSLLEEMFALVYVVLSLWGSSHSQKSQKRT